MAQIIKDGEVVQDQWQVVESLEGVETLPEGKILISSTDWDRFQSEISTRADDIGVWLASDTDPSTLESFISAPLIAVKFDNFADGRGFSIARLLRERHDYVGEIRAIGAPIRDQLTYMSRCGFNAFDLADHYDSAEAIASLTDFSDNYQISVEQKTPLFRRRM